MPMKTLQVCSFCEEPAKKFHPYTLTNASSSRTYELCDDCNRGEYMRELLAAGEKTAPVKVVAKKTSARVTKKKTVASTATKAPLVRNADGLYQCDGAGCDYTHERAAAVGRHRASKNHR